MGGYEMALRNERNNIQSTVPDINEINKYSGGEDNDARDSNAFSKQKTVSWTRLTIIFDRLLLCVFVLLNVVVFTFMFIIVPIVK